MGWFYIEEQLKLNWNLEWANGLRELCNIPKFTLRSLYYLGYVSTQNLPNLALEASSRFPSPLRFQHHVH